eukprot:GFYU01008472.1.p1 GENE.GFYU01008472.1~~GFYU01008472.1.p1  ORF type:complete len:456 (+),score=127.67 GFYU01008472.1:152-1519(+)
MSDRVSVKDQQKAAADVDNDKDKVHPADNKGKRKPSNNILDHKSPLCTHKKNCLETFLVRACKSAGYGYLFKTGLGCVFGLLLGGAWKKPDKLGPKLKEIFGRDSINFALFMGLMNGGYRGAVCLLRHYRKTDDEINTLVAGAVSGLAILVDSEDRRTTMALYLMVRALDFTYQRFVREGKVPEIVPGAHKNKTYYTLLMCVCASWTMVCGGFWRDVFFPSYLKFLLQMCNLHPTALDWVATSSYMKQPFDHQRVHNFLKPYGMEVPKLMPGEFIPCKYRHPHYPNCTENLWRAWIRAFGIALKLYTPIHTIPTLINGGHKDPVNSITKIGNNAFWSSVFLASYIGSAHTWWCTLRNMSGYDHPWHMMIAGISAGLPLVFERPSRRPELALYCLAQSTKALWSYGVKFGHWKPIKGGNAFLFALSNAIIMYHYKHKPETVKPTFLKLLKKFYDER